MITTNTTSDVTESLIMVDLLNAARLQRYYNFENKPNFFN